MSILHFKTATYIYLFLIIHVVQGVQLRLNRSKTYMMSIFPKSDFRQLLRFYLLSIISKFEIVYLKIRFFFQITLRINFKKIIITIDRV